MWFRCPQGNETCMHVERLHNSFMYHYLGIVDVHRLNISQYLLRIVAKGTISIQRYKDWTLTYHIFFYLNKPFQLCMPKLQWCFFKQPMLLYCTCTIVTLAFKIISLGWFKVLLWSNTCNIHIWIQRVRNLWNGGYVIIWGNTFK